MTPGELLLESQLDPIPRNFPSVVKQLMHVFSFWLPRAFNSVRMDLNRLGNFSMLQLCDLAKT